MTMIVRPGGLSLTTSFKWCRAIIAALTVSAAGFAAVPASAEDDPFEDLRQRIEKLERENERLQAERAERIAKVEPQSEIDSADSDMPPAPGPEAPAGDEEVRQRLLNLESTMSTLSQRLQFGVVDPNRPRSTDIAPIMPTTAAPTYPSVKLTGFFQLDSYNFDQSGGNRHQFGIADNGVGFRRARLAAVGDVTRNVSYMLEMDFAFPGRPSFMDVWFDVHDLALVGNVRAGQWRQPFGIDNLTSARELTFLERPLMFGLAPFRQTGVGIHDNNQDVSLTWAASVYGSETDAWGNSLGNKGMGQATRITAIPWYEDEGKQIVHVGFDYCFTVPNGSAGVTYRNTAEYGGLFSSGIAQTVPGGATGGGSTLDTPFIYNTGPLFFNQSNMFNFEQAGVYNHLHWQQELLYNVMNFASGTAVIPAYSGQVAYLLTGEVRPYNKVAGVLGRIKPLRPFGECGGMGAWEVAARYSYLDANTIVPFQHTAFQAASPVGPVIPWGGAVNDVTFGLNWYLNAYTKVQFNYIIANCNRRGVGAAPNTYGNGISSVCDILAVRAQLDF